MLAILAVGVLATFVPGVEATLQRFVELSEDETGNGRSELYDCAWSMFYTNPLFGSGGGRIRSTLRRHRLAPCITIWDSRR